MDGCERVALGLIRFLNVVGRTKIGVVGKIGESDGRRAGSGSLSRNFSCLNILHSCWIITKMEFNYNKNKH